MSSPKKMGDLGPFQLASIDADADRLAIVDNTGFPIGEESTLILAVESYLKHYK